MLAPCSAANDDRNRDVERAEVDAIQRLYATLRSKQERLADECGSARVGVRFEETPDGTLMSPPRTSTGNQIYIAPRSRASPSASKFTSPHRKPVAQGPARTTALSSPLTRQGRSNSPAWRPTSSPLHAQRETPRASRSSPHQSREVTRPQVVEFMRQVLQPHYNAGLLPQTAFVSIVKNVSADFFGAGRTWRTGNGRDDAEWQRYLTERLEHYVMRFARHGGPTMPLYH